MKPAIHAGHLKIWTPVWNGHWVMVLKSHTYMNDIGTTLENQDTFGGPQGVCIIQVSLFILRSVFVIPARGFIVSTVH